jgi:hypothetical protein
MCKIGNNCMKSKMALQKDASDVVKGSIGIPFSIAAGGMAYNLRVCIVCKEFSFEVPVAVMN